MSNDNELATASRAGVLRLEVVTPDGPAVRTEADQVEAWRARFGGQEAG